MGVQSVDWVALGPALTPAVAALLVLTLDAVLGRRRPGVRTLLDVVAVLGILGGLAAVLPLTGGTRRTFCVAGGSCGYAASPLTVALQVMVLLSALVCLLLALGDGPRRAAVRPELALGAPLAVLTLVLGLLPWLVLRTTEPSVQRLLELARGVV